MSRREAIGRILSLAASAGMPAAAAKSRITRFEAFPVRVPMAGRIREAWYSSFSKQGRNQTHFSATYVRPHTDDGLAGIGETNLALSKTEALLKGMVGVDDGSGGMHRERRIAARARHLIGGFARAPPPAGFGSVTFTRLPMTWRPWCISSSGPQGRSSSPDSLRKVRRSSSAAGLGHLSGAAEAVVGVRGPVHRAARRVGLRDALHLAYRRARAGIVFGLDDAFGRTRIPRLDFTARPRPSNVVFVNGRWLWPSSGASWCRRRWSRRRWGRWRKPGGPRCRGLRPRRDSGRRRF